MYPVAVVGDNPAARAALLACRRSGFNDLTWSSIPDESKPSTLPPAYTLPANITRVIQALCGTQALDTLAYVPDREQIRFGPSAYLLSELPLGQFSQDRYGAPHVNIETDDLMALLHPSVDPSPLAEIRSLEQEHDVVILTESPDRHGDHQEQTNSHELWHATAPFDAGLARANITWLGTNQTIWQFATPRRTHFLMSSPINRPLVHNAWHSSLHEAIHNAERIGSFDAGNTQVREHWYEGHVVHLGDACYTANSYRREGQALGLEDAWVLGRMLENYEEDIGDGLREYARYRRPRTRKVAADVALIARQHNMDTQLKRAMRNLNTAFSTRFMPEIAMQRIDWFYGYDCIRGFR